MASVGEDVGERYFKLSVQIYKEYWNVFFFFGGGGGNSSYELRNLLTGWKGCTTDVLKICIRF